MTEIFYNDALASAEKLDQYFEENGRPIGPLHGLPVSLKDNINVAGYASTTGLVTYAEEIVDKDSVVTQILRELGAVLYVKTNVPGQFLSTLFWE